MRNIKKVLLFVLKVFLRLFAIPIWILIAVLYLSFSAVFLPIVFIVPIFAWIFQITDDPWQIMDNLTDFVFDTALDKTFSICEKMVL